MLNPNAICADYITDTTHFAYLYSDILKAEELKRPGSTWSYDVDRYALRAVLEGSFRREAVGS